MIKNENRMAYIEDGVSNIQTRDKQTWGFEHGMSKIPSWHPKTIIIVPWDNQE